MKTAKRSVLLILCAMLLVVASVFGTMAFLTDTASVKNTFTVGKVDIDLDETDVDEYGVAVTPAARAVENEYKLISGHTYIKDPTVTVVEGSEPSYVRAIVTISDIADLKAAFGVADDADINLVEFLTWDDTFWTASAPTYADGKAVYIFEYKEAVDARDEVKVLEPVFTNFTIADGATNAQLEALDDLEIDILAQAIQADGFGTAAAAWAAFPAA